MDNINYAPIESFQEEIKTYVLEMISQSELYLKKDGKPVRIGHSKSIYTLIIGFINLTKKIIHRNKVCYSRVINNPIK